MSAKDREKEQNYCKIIHNYNDSKLSKDFTDINAKNKYDTDISFKKTSIEKSGFDLERLNISHSKVLIQVTEDNQLYMVVDISNLVSAEEIRRRICDYFQYQDISHVVLSLTEIGELGSKELLSDNDLLLACSNADEKGSLKLLLHKPFKQKSDRTNGKFIFDDMQETKADDGFIFNKLQRSHRGYDSKFNNFSASCSSDNLENTDLNKGIVKESNHDSGILSVSQNDVSDTILTGDFPTIKYPNKHYHIRAHRKAPSIPLASLKSNTNEYPVACVDDTLGNLSVRMEASLAIVGQKSINYKASIPNLKFYSLQHGIKRKPCLQNPKLKDIFLKNAEKTENKHNYAFSNKSNTFPNNEIKCEALPLKISYDSQKKKPLLFQQ